MRCQTLLLAEYVAEISALKLKRVQTAETRILLVTGRSVPDAVAMLIP